jgi:hypothetical protein
MRNQERGPLKLMLRLTVGLALLWLWGCYPPSALEMDYGNSVRNNIAQTVLNPQAGLNPTPPVGLPPQAAVNEMNSYNNSFTAAEQQKASQSMQTQVTTSSGY